MTVTITFTRTRDGWHWQVACGSISHSGQTTTWNDAWKEAQVISKHIVDRENTFTSR
jgi:hypothetical protein